METALPSIPAKRYFTIGEVSELCGVKPYVLRYWEQEFTQLKPMKRRGNRRYYQHHEVLLIRRIRELLYDQGFTIVGARNRLSDAAAASRAGAAAEIEFDADADVDVDTDVESGLETGHGDMRAAPPLHAAEAAVAACPALEPQHLRAELLSIRELLTA